LPRSPSSRWSALALVVAISPWGLTSCGDAPTSAAPDAAADTVPEAVLDASPDATPDTRPADLADGLADAVADTAEPGPDPCAEVDAFRPVFAANVATFAAQDALGGWPTGPLVFAGSSSVRRWEGFAQAYTDYAPLQRGMGGAQLAEIAYSARTLITSHDPRAILVYAGTNDLSAGVAADVVLDRLRCLRARIGQDLGWDRPLLFVGVTPNPARWSSWPTAAAFNAAAASLAETDPALTFIDVAPTFLATGEPPMASLFVSDGLHLSASGYALWDSVIRPVVAATLAPKPHAVAPVPALPAGTRVLVDLGPSNPEDGEVSPSPDYRGQHWNNWHALPGGGTVLPGEQRVDLVTTTGSPTAIDLVVTGGFMANGRRNGGLLWPDAALLGDLAVGSATGDFFYIEGDDVTGGLFLRDLDPAARYTLRLFAARDDAQVRVTRYTVSGTVSATATLQTSGAGAGHDGATTNDDDVVTFTDVRPDAWGHVFIDVAREQGTYGYLSALELTVE